MNNNRAIELIRKYLLGKANRDEEKKIDDWYNSINDTDSLQTGNNDPQLHIAKEEIYQKLKTELALQKEKPVVYFYNRPLFRAAVLITAVFSMALIFFIKNRHDKNDITVAKQSANNKSIKPPSGNKATLKLASGKIIHLAGSGMGTLAVQSNMNVVKLADGRIAYHGYSAGTVIYNTLSVPRGSTPLKVVLSDGTEVLLNVESSITYPIAFAGNKRQVEITGEAYFEVAKNAAMPFVVKRLNHDAQVRVLGTHFNVNTYDDEDAMKVTLVEGSVDISKAGNHKILTPGQQATITGNTIKVLNKADLEEALAWKNGRFDFDGADIKTVMRQLEKWYDVQVSYQSDINYSFVAKISKDVDIADILTILERTDLVHFKVEGTKITVTK